MNRRLFLSVGAAVPLALFAGSLSGCGADKTARNIRVSVDVETPHGKAVGESVLQYATYRRDSAFTLPQSRGTSERVRGEAVAVDLGEGRVLFALLKGIEPALRLAGNHSGQVARRHYPMLVTFDDLDDPTSVKEVDPDDLAATFGEGYALGSISVQITQDEVTTGIEERLPWFRSVADSGGGLIPMVKNEKGRWEVAPGYDAKLVDFGVTSFSTEVYK